jgi:signal transduction histidine kinase
MAERAAAPRPESGPGNKIIVTTLLESLAVRGQAASRDRAVRALELADGGLAEARAWLADDTVARMFFAADVDPSLARALGHRLIAPDATGLRLYSLGLATPEKAFRRVQTLLPRAGARASWTPEEIAPGSAQLCFREAEPQPDDANPNRRGIGNARTAGALCAMRIGMLEAVPGLFGLLPARVTESTCLARGADACRYDVRWQRGSHAALLTGAGIGLALGAAIFAFSPLPLAAGLACGLVGLALTASVGRVIDLQRQLEAVAGARRGHLALFDQVDDALASKLDALARADAKLESFDFSARIRLGVSGESSPADPAALSRSEVVFAAQQIHVAAGDLECDLASELEDAAKIGRARELVREIRRQSAKIAGADIAEGEGCPQVTDLVGLVGRAIATVRPMLPHATRIELESDDDLRAIECEPIQIEQVVVQLIRNAAEASRALSEVPEVWISLRNGPRGVEIGVEDRGVGIESAELDEVFDPFFGDRRVGVDEGFGLPVCLRIVERHGGELRIESEDRTGTRVSVLLPDSRPGAA